MKRIKLGIIGTGLAARNLHLPVLQKLNRKYEIVAVSNRTLSKAKDFSRQIGNVPYYKNYMDMLKREDIEAVDIAVPINLNYKVTADSLKMGKHIILEKPLCANLREAETLINLNRKSRAITMVAENFYFRKSFKQAKKYITDGKIGNPYAINWNLYYHVEENRDYAATKWRLKHTYSGGFMLDAGVHNIAAIRYMLGDFESGKAFTTSVNKKIGEIDTMSFQFQLKNQIFGVYNLFFSVKANWEDKLLIFGSEGTIEFQNTNLTLRRVGRDDLIKKYDTDYGFQEEFENFYNAIRNGHKVAYSFREAKRDLEITLGAIRSARTNRKVIFN